MRERSRRVERQARNEDSGISAWNNNYAAERVGVLKRRAGQAGVVKEFAGIDHLPDDLAALCDFQSPDTKENVS
jgi:hypothetical protein